MRLFKVTACIPCPEKSRSQRELQNTFFTKWVPYESWFAEQQRIMKQGGKILKVELVTGQRRQLTPVRFQITNEARFNAGLFSWS
jgi:phycobilisome core linker protein